MSNRASFTPGPWFQVNTADIFTGLGAPRADGSEAPPNDGWMIADCDMGGCLPFDEVKANARLIAAAPDLLEALAYLLGDVKAFNDLEEEDSARLYAGSVFRAEQAIAKATGADHER